MIELSQDQNEMRPRICVIGVGGAGGNAVASLASSNVCGLTLIAANTDIQALSESPATHLIQLGSGVTQGLGAGSRPELGKAAAEESLDEIGALLDGAHMCFIAAGLGGGTGTGAAPVIAKAARDRGILTVAIVTTPFNFEGTRRARAAQAGLDELRAQVDTLIVIPNQNLFRIVGPATTFREAFAMADEVLHQGVRGITDLIVMPGLINLDFADIRTVMSWMGSAMMGSAQAEGEGRALVAAEAAIANPLLDGSLAGAKGLIISITGGDDLRLMEVDEVASHISAMADPDADIIWGSAFDAELSGRIRVSIVATGLDSESPSQVQQPVESIVIQPARRETLLEPLPEEPVMEAPDDGELLLTIGPVAPTPAASAIAAPIIVDAVPEAPAPGPSLFERMATAARSLPLQARQDPPPLRRLSRGRDLAAPDLARAA